MIRFKSIIPFRDFGRTGFHIVENTVPRFRENRSSYCGEYRPEASGEPVFILWRIPSRDFGRTGLHIVENTVPRFRENRFSYCGEYRPEASGEPVFILWRIPDSNRSPLACQASTLAK